MMQFQLPSKITPTMFLNQNVSTFTPLTVDYTLEIEFMTEKNDRYVLIAPLVIEDNFPPREILPPPSMPVYPPSQNSQLHDKNEFSASTTPSHYNPYEQQQRSSYQQNSPPSEISEPPPAYSQPPPSYNYNYNDAPSSSNPNFSGSSNIPRQSSSSAPNIPHNNQGGDSLYPVLPGMTPYTPPVNQQPFTLPPAYNPSF